MAPVRLRPDQTRDCFRARARLRAEKLNGAKIKTLVQKLGKETIAVAKKTEGKNAGKIQPLGEALSHAGDPTEE